MALPSFSEFQWLHPQPGWTINKPKFQIINDDKVQTQAAKVVAWRVMRWHGFSLWEIVRLARVREEWKRGER